MALKDTDGSSGIQADNKVIIVGRTNSTATADTADVAIKHNKGHGYKTKIGIDTDYSTADDATRDRRRDSAIDANKFALGTKGLVRSGGTGGNVKAFKSYTKGKDIFETAASATTLALGAHGQLLYVDGSNIKARMNPTTMTTQQVYKTTATAVGPNNDTAPGLNSYNDTVTYYTKINAQASVKTNNLTLSSSK